MIIGIELAIAPFGQANALTVAEIRENLSAEEQTHYVAGVVEGLAFARWIADDRDATGMNCIWSWYLGSDTQARFNQQMTMFDRHPDQQVSTLMYALIREECGE
jgi:hypothetical protein